MLVGTIAGGALLLALIVAGGAWFSTQLTAHTPQAAARPYLDALVSGDVAAVTELGHISTTSPLVSRKAYAHVQGHVTAYSVRAGEVGDDTATVVVDYRQNGDMHTQTLALKKTGTDMLFFSKWELEPVTLPSIQVTVEAPEGATAEVSGTKVAVDSRGTAHVDVLPGNYDVELGDDRYFVADGASVWVTDLTAHDAAPATAVSLEATLTDAGSTAAKAAVNAWVASCIAQHSISPKGCSFGLIDNYPDVHLTNQKWTLVSAPKFDIGTTGWDHGGWIVDTVTPGSATFLADASTDDGRYGTLFSMAPLRVAVEGAITGFDSKGHAIFRSIDWSGKEATANA
jgi:hypothetical protein